MTKVYTMTARHEFYAIREKTTGYFLPQSNRTTSKGFTNSEPCDTSELPPRLFTKEAAAKCALTWWLRGVFKQAKGAEYDEPGGKAYGYNKGPTKRPIPGTGRDPDLMEVVRITLELDVDYMSLDLCTAYPIEGMTGTSQTGQ